MNDSELKIKNFSDEWQGHGYEKGETQKFWLNFLRVVLSVEEPDKLIDFEKPLKIGKHTKFIDAYIAKTKVLIEQKSFGIDLNKGAFKQANFYAENMPPSEQPRWIVTCNFAEFIIHDRAEMYAKRLDKEEYTPLTFKLHELRTVYPSFKFLVDPDAKPLPEVTISNVAANMVKIIYDDFEKNYCREGVKSDKTFLDTLCTRLVFCFYASYAQIIDDKNFFEYLKRFKDAERRIDALQEMFDALNTPENERDNFDDALKKFPHVNGGLFEKKISFPERIRFKGDPTASIIAADIPKKLNWRKISPPIFGAMFESVLNPETRRAGGMHYTIEDNIHKVIDPLFYDELKKEFIAATRRKDKANRIQALRDLQDKLASLTFLDPACGSGNFLTETYLSLRELENNIIEVLRKLKAELPDNPIKVSINQFYGIEVHDFAAAVAQVAMYIAENQMLQQTNDKFAKNLKQFPLEKYTNITIGNALRLDWHSVAPAVNFIIGNPPFVGARMKSAAQKADMQHVFAGWDNIGNLDYVTCWYKKAADFIKSTNIRCAFVSTNSVCQGDQVGALWKNLFAADVHIDFAHRTFKWFSDSDNMAHVHCVIVGFSVAPNDKGKVIFDGGKPTPAKNINAYLVDGENIFVESRNEPLQDGVPEINFGSMPNDGGNLIIEADDYESFIKSEPAAAKYIHSYIGAKEFINGLQRRCLWLEGVPLDEIKTMPLVAERVEACRQCRLKSKRAATRRLAATPALFAENRQPTTNYILVPRITSERRRYIPIGFMSPDVIARDGAQTIPDATIYHFGVLTSSIHMAWVRTVCGRLEMRYNYSATVVYNNFPWPNPTADQRRAIEETAQKILDVRAGFEGWTFAALYNPETMPPPLRNAHKHNDLNVALAYGFDSIYQDEAAVVAELMKLYRRLTS